MKKSTQKPGFALIATISIMLLIVLIAMAMLTLSTTTIRDQRQGNAQAEAQANARLALMLALGELQKQMGPDQRISANGAIVSQDDVSHPHWMGVWNSWKAGNGEASQHQTIEGVSSTAMAPTYLPARNDYFRGWLLSLDPSEAAAVTSATDLALNGNPVPGTNDVAVRLVGAGSVGAAALPQDYVSARLMPVTKTTDSSATAGRYGWWIGDESQKARLMPDSYQSGTLTAADKIFRSLAPGSMGNKSASGLETISDEGQLAKLPSMRTLDFLDLGTPPADGSPSISQQNFHSATIFGRGVLADVREGGLKRDLSTILEQPIRAEDGGQEYMLYEFDDPRFSDRSNSRVPIQDLAAYYQLYDDDPQWGSGRRGGISYNSASLPNSIQTVTPDYGGASRDRTRIQGEYTTLYKQPAIAKIQFLLATGAQQVAAAERQFILDKYNEAQALNNDSDPNNNSRSRIVPMRDTDTHKLLLGIIPIVTLWNPNNVPMVVDRSQVLRFNTPPFALRWRKYRAAGDIYHSNYFNLNYAMGGSSVTSGQAEWGRPYIITYRFAKDNKIVFKPGEVKMFSTPTSAGGTLREMDGVTELSHLARFRDHLLDPINLWNPNGIFLVPRGSPQGAYGNQAPDVFNFNRTIHKYDNLEFMVFERGDRITMEVVVEEANNDQRDGRRVTIRNEVLGAGFNISMRDEGFFPGVMAVDCMRNYQMMSRYGGVFVHRSQLPPVEIRQAEYHQKLMIPAFPGGQAPIEFKDQTNAIPGGDIIDASNAGDAIGLMDFSLSYGCEVGSNNVGGFAGGRRLASRPFLHGGLNAAPFIDRANPAAFYNYSWDWQLNSINNIEDSIVQGEPATGRGYFGGGYTIEAGTTHVVQRDIPVLPPISIASLSHAHLGGFSLARNNIIGENPATDDFRKSIWDRTAANRIRVAHGTDYQQITATGQGGLAPHVVQAIGNSYAHPNIPANKAFGEWDRYFDAHETSVNVPFVDHSYLANKALWDEYFFSSIAPQPASVELYGGASRTTQQVATDYFMNGKPLPNRRIIPHSSGMSSVLLEDMFSEYGEYSDGFADKIAAHLMVDGSFNINSTSIEAWKVLFSSLRGKPSAYLESGKTPSEKTHEGSVVSLGSLPAAEPIDSGSITEPNSPPEQWRAGRELSDDEIEDLATAMVKQVKLRGPFLSLSEFINRRLDGSNEELALKGALQAAIDDPDVAINEAFRNAGRQLDAETAAANFAFDAAADGPVAYGSAAYVDQADILRGLASQLTPRGDTFVIRAYGDSLSESGEVRARAWCEAVVQRVPEYISSIDEAHVKQADLTSEENKQFGRKLNIVGFRWLKADEI